MQILKDKYNITELSSELELTDHTLRYYEKEFSLPVPRDDRGRRYYTTELANTLYQIKAMRKDGLQIKAIKKILQSESIISDPPPVVFEDQSDSMSLTVSGRNINTIPYQNDINHFVEEFKSQINESVCREVQSVMNHFSEEIRKSKLELGACIENNMRKMESKMDEHFKEVDRSISDWRRKRKRNPIRKVLNIFK